MRAFKADHFSLLLSSSQKLASGLDIYLRQISSHNIELTFGVIIEVAKAIKQQHDPIRKINALVAVLRFMQEATYPVLLFCQVYVVPALTKVVEYLLDNRDFQSVASFFERTGLTPNTPHIQNLSYNFAALTCRVLQKGSIIKPFRVYEGHQYEQPSLFGRWYDKMVKERVDAVFGGGQKRAEADRWRQLYGLSLGRWGEYADSMVYFFMEMLDAYLASENSDKISPFFDILQYGESIITEETIARLIDILAYHLSFDVRIKALKLYDRLILWGDVEALLVINFTENIQTIIKAFLRVKGEGSLDEGRHIYPDINGQQLKKQEFHRFFLMCFQSWAATFPNHQFLVPSSANINEISPIYHLYKLLRQKKKTIFENNPLLGRYKIDARMAMLQKTFRNRLIIKEIDNQSDLSSVSIVVSNKLGDLQQYFETHKEMFINLVSKKVNLYEAMQKLAQFELHFEQMVQNLSLGDDPGNVLDKLIQNGLELIQIVTLIHVPFLQLLHNELTQNQFLDKIIHQCVNYISNSEERQFVSFYSQKVAHKKEALVQMLRLQKSDPLEKDLKFISNSIIVKQFRHKYRLKLEKMSSSKNSEQSSINLEIFTKTKFTTESRQQMERSFKFDTKQSFKETVSSNKDLLKVKNSEFSVPNSLKGSRQKKKLTLASKQLQNRKKDSIQNQNQNQFVLKLNKLQVTSQTRSSCDRQSQKSSKQTDHLVSFQDNSQYFAFMPNEQYKFSYVCHNLLIFKSPFITIERSISHDEQYANRVKIQIHLITHKFIPDFQFSLEDQECIKMEYQPQNLPLNLESNCKFKIQIYGQMKKIPLRFPTIAMFIRKKMFFQYILPFTFNFFLKQNVKKSASQHYNQIQIQAKHRYLTKNLILSKMLFPHQTLKHLSYIFPGCFLDQQSSKEMERYLWLASYGNLTFLFVFQLNLSSRHLQIRAFDAGRSDDYNLSMLKYSVNFFARMLSERQA